MPPKAQHWHSPGLLETGPARHASLMRGLVQRVTRASVDVLEGPIVNRVGEIGAGLCVLVGVTHTDDTSTADKLADKIWNLRIFDDSAGVMNRSLSERFDGGSQPEVLIVSQFTLYGDTSKGRRPSWIDAARPDHAEPLVERVVTQLVDRGAVVATGRFRTDMRVEIVNDGPVTLVLEV